MQRILLSANGFRQEGLRPGDSQDTMLALAINEAALMIEQGVCDSRRTWIWP